MYIGYIYPDPGINAWHWPCTGPCVGHLVWVGKINNEASSLELQACFD